jgi:hypothetical protein
VRRVEASPHTNAGPDLIAELEQIDSVDGLLRWALNALPRRNRMTEEDLRKLNRAFTARKEALGVEPRVGDAPEPPIAGGLAASSTPSLG